MNILAANRTRAGVLVLVGGLIAGALDITYACAFWAIKASTPAQRIFQSVAKGLLGSAAFKGGAATAALGLFLHFFIATSMSITYYLIARSWPPLYKHPLRYGAAYGLVLYAVMNSIVVPLSAAGGGSQGDRLWIVLSIVVHVFLIGVPIAFFTSRAISAATSSARIQGVE
jgi:hypothetical protein